MTKIIEATCVGGVVTAEGVPVDSADILTDGVGQSSGVLLVDELKAKYLASSVDDIKAILDSLNTILTQLTVTLTAIDALTTSPSSNTAAIGLLTTYQNQLYALKQGLR